jgi:ureidoglycolate lyase
MTDRIVIQPLTAAAFAPFGDILDCSGAPDKLINQGLCGRYHDRAKLDFSDGRAGISIFHAQLRTFPMRLDLVERHPEGSQAFLPLDSVPFVVVVAPDVNGKPGRPLAFVTQPGQGVNYHRGVWHGVLVPVAGNGIFAVVDRIGSGANLEEHPFDDPPLLIME